jgi:hypothetical protein|tara:strand:+ start:4015 stop:4182 length:168 start_codon:yes stop_codon:yes gene_type:complete
MSTFDDIDIFDPKFLYDKPGAKKGILELTPEERRKKNKAVAEDRKRNRKQLLKQP